MADHKHESTCCCEQANSQQIAEDCLPHGHSHEHCGCEHHHDHAHNHSHEHHHEGCACGLDHDISFETCGEDGCGHDHSHSEGKSAWLSIIAAAVLAAFSFLPVPDAASHLMLAAAAIIAGFPLFWSGIKSMIRLRLDETALLLIAVVAAMALGEFWAGALVTILFRLGNQLEGLAVARSKKSIAALTKIRPETANLLQKKWKLSRNCCCFHSHRIPNFD